MSFPIPPDEEARLRELREMDILDTLPEQAYDDITLLASQVCGTPIALVSLVDEGRQWFRSRQGLETPETPREQSFCAHALGRPREMFVVPDATQDERFKNNALVTGEPDIRFYAGAPLVTGEGHALGTLCVIDSKPRELSPEQERALQALSRQVMAQMELRRKNAELDESRRSFEAFMDASPAVAFIKDDDGRFVYVNQPFLNRFNLRCESVIGATDADLFGDSAPELREHDVAVMAGDSVVPFLESVRGPAGDDQFWQVYKFPLRFHGARVLAGLGLDVTDAKLYERQLEEYQFKLEEALARVETQSVTDALTGLRNRRAFEQKLAEEFERGTRYGAPLSILMMDVDKFKSYNDTFGHPAGDDLLQKVAALLAEKARTSDFVARYGGEEFVVILPATGSEGASILAERFRRAVAFTPWPRRAVTVSIGVATLGPDIATGEALLQAADKALYEAKANGRNRVARAR